jgi:HTH-type transcriptional regulator, sugar sensing transcriptional regulator
VDANVFVDRLTRLGLTSYESRAYVALIRRDSSSAAEVARVANLPRQRIYDVLGSLVGKGLASTRPGSQVRYAAVAPEMAVERLMARQRATLAELERNAADVVAGLGPEFMAGQGHTDPLEYIEVLRDRGAINERFADLQAQVKREILVFTKPPYARAPQDNVAGIEIIPKVVARSIYERSLFEDSDATDGVRRFVEAGEEARVVDELPLKLVIIDETIVMFGMADPVANSEALTIVVVEHPSLATVLKVAFNAIWENGQPFLDALAHHGSPVRAPSGGGSTVASPIGQGPRRFI